ncbi:MAG: hypothetical protein JSV62_14515 [Promethearchaeota archaeon]|nr:MAG: hypothetical protein JSV62_14515 [Candidatus Lokiarchaeota archaeon]
MNKKGLIAKLAIITTFVILILGILPAAQASPPPFVQDLNPEENLLMPWWFGYWEEHPPGNYYYVYQDWEFSSSENLYFRIGWQTWWIEIENDWAPKWPYKYRLFINNVEIDLQRYDVPVPKEDKEIIAKTTFWYHIFGPGYFTEGGEYILRWEFWVKRPYQGDGLNHWRIFVDYWGIISPPGSVSSFEYPLNIVA